MKTLFAILLLSCAGFTSAPLPEDNTLSDCEMQCFEEHAGIACWDACYEYEEDEEE